MSIFPENPPPSPKLLIDSFEPDQKTLDVFLAIPHYRDRLSVRPGVTGLAQVQLPADTDVASVRRKLAYDLYYVRCCNPWLDLRIILCTGLHVLGVPYHTLRKLFLMPSLDKVEHAYRNARVLPGQPIPHMQAV